MRYHLGLVWADNFVNYGPKTQCFSAIWHYSDGCCNTIHITKTQFSEIDQLGTPIDNSPANNISTELRYTRIYSLFICFFF